MFFISIFGKGFFSFCDGNRRFIRGITDNFINFINDRQTLRGSVAQLHFDKCVAQSHGPLNQSDARLLFVLFNLIKDVKIRIDHVVLEPYADFGDVRQPVIIHLPFVIHQGSKIYGTQIADAKIRKSLFTTI